jgi:hypothetical protein
MTEQELRALVRDAIATHAAAHAVEAPLVHAPRARLHPSHALMTLPAGADGDGLCIIEPAVACNHCGYCKSLGH